MKITALNSESTNRRLAYWAGFVCVLLLAAAVARHDRPRISPGMYQKLTDEEVYLEYATQFNRKGIAGIRESIGEFLRNPEDRQHYPSPLRLTAIFLGAAAVSFGGANLASLQQLSFASYLAVLVFSFFWAKRLAGPGEALATMLLVACSPLQLGLAGRALADPSVALFMAAGLALFIKAVFQEKTSKAWIGVAWLYTCALLAKESALILLPLSLGVMGWAAWRGKRKINGLLLCAATVFPVLAALLVLTLVAGDWSAVYQVASRSAFSVGSNTYAAQFGSGPWYRYLIDFLLLSPWLVVLFLAWLGVSKDKLGQPHEIIVWSLLPLAAILLMAPFTKNIRYALWLDLPLRFCAVLGLSYFLGLIWRGRSRALALSIAVIGLSMMDLLAFTQLFVAGALYDPVTLELLIRRQIVR